MLAPVAIKSATEAVLQNVCVEFPVGAEVLFIVTVTANLPKLSHELIV